ncbi:hypothetical protein GCM10010123_31960 [Pilimelia anulata]|uniref:Uncharacterized protein n=1 Tax=Pilimelia anulata TaxID=53371 RepID=A0A8J3BAG3_9ACTN|nr:hypothetical protein GCM10010123_31960 [Pilimelia anulata]
MVGHRVPRRRVRVAAAAGVRLLLRGRGLLRVVCHARPIPTRRARTRTPPGRARARRAGGGRRRGSRAGRPIGLAGAVR